MKISPPLLRSVSLIALLSSALACDSSVKSNPSDPASRSKETARENVGAAELPLPVSPEAKPDTKYKFVICLLHPKTETQEGVVEKATFEKDFLKDYAIAGERFSAPKGSVVDGVLLASDGNTVVSLPIVHWEGENGPIYLCQGTVEVTKAPSFSAVESSRESLLKMINARLTKK